MHLLIKRNMGRVCKYFSKQSLKMMRLGMKVGSYLHIAHIATDYRCASQHEILRQTARGGPQGGLNFGKVGFWRRSAVTVLAIATSHWGNS
ncbi:MAG: hypothetical protein RSE34_04765 [Brevundimonas sp.]